MDARRRIVPRSEMFATLLHKPTQNPALRCRATIVLDGKKYQCGREHVDGIHDAFVEHHDGGAVRW